MKASRLAAAIAAATVITGCGGSPVFVSATDPVIGICQQATVTSLDNQQSVIDDANAVYGSDTAVPMAPREQHQMASSARVLTGDERSVLHAHPTLAEALRRESSLLMVASQAPRGLTTNGVTLSVDNYTRQIDGLCGSYVMGTAPRPSKPGPGIWKWGLFWKVVGGYLLMIMISSLMIGVATRSRPRDERLTPGQIMARSLIWPLIVPLSAGEMWAQVLERVRLTPEDRKDDRLAALAKENGRLEQVNLELQRLASTPRPKETG